MEADSGQGEDSGSAGFTLIEVMVVVLIIGILLGIGVPTFLGARERAQDRAAQANLATASSAANVVAMELGGINSSKFDELVEFEPALDWVWWKELSTGPGEISFAAHAADGDWAAAVLSDSGTCFLVKDWDTTSTRRFATVEADQCSAYWAIRLAINDSW